MTFWMNVSMDTEMPMRMPKQLQIKWKQKNRWISWNTQSYDDTVKIFKKKMSSNDVLCNGNSGLPGSDHSLRKDSQKNLLTNHPVNLNWLIYLAYARGDYQYCKDIINHQLGNSYDYEYLYLMQVSRPIDH